MLKGKKVTMAVAGVAALLTSSLIAISSSANAAAVCTAGLGKATKAVKLAENSAAPWTGPKTGPKAATGKTIYFVAQTMQNGGVAGAEKGVEEAAKAIGWTVKVLDGQGTQTGMAQAMSEAVTLKADGIVVGGFDPATTSDAIKAAQAANIPVIGWHAEATAGPQPDAGLFTNVTTLRKDVSKISADWAIVDSKGRGGVVVFSDFSIPFAHGKSDEIVAELKTCPSVTLLKYDNIPIGNSTSTLMQSETAALLAKFGKKWTQSISINGSLYVTPIATAMRAAGLKGSDYPHNVGAGDGSTDEYSRIASGSYQSVTVPEPLNQEGWQIVDEFNRAFNNVAATGYVPATHLVTKANIGNATSWDPQNGYRNIYKKIWGVM
jgi:ABC-type sugar transport system substrate-binding protein